MSARKKRSAPAKTKRTQAKRAPAKTKRAPAKTKRKSASRSEAARKGWEERKRRERREERAQKALRKKRRAAAVKGWDTRRSRAYEQAEREGIQGDEFEPLESLAASHPVFLPNTSLIAPTAGELLDKAPFITWQGDSVGSITHEGNGWIIGESEDGRTLRLMTFVNSETGEARLRWIPLARGLPKLGAYLADDSYEPLRSNKYSVRGVFA